MFISLCFQYPDTIKENWNDYITRIKLKYDKEFKKLMERLVKSKR